MWRITLVGLLTLVACSGKDEGAVGAPKLQCAAGEVPAGDVCAPKIDACDERSVPKLGGGCTAVGIATCGKGFASDEKGGCAPVLPPAPCPAGKLAVPGETTCHDVAACGEGTWGSIVADANTVFVDAASTAGTPDGSRDRPFKTIAEATAAVKIDGTVAIAAGTYAEHVLPTRTMTVWGRCPQMVTIESDPAAPKFAVELLGNVRLRGVSITGKGGVGVSGENATLEEVWIHDVAERGVFVDIPRGKPASVTIRRSLIEKVVGFGVGAFSSTVVIEDSVIRDVSPQSGNFGDGVLATKRAGKTAPSLTMKRSLVERASDVGVGIEGGKAVIEGLVVRDTKPRSTGIWGLGFYAATAPMDPTPADLDMRDTFLAGNRDTGMTVEGSTAKITRLVVRDTKPGKDGMLGEGLHIEIGATVTLEDSVVDGNRYAGIDVVDSTVTIARTIVRATRPDDTGVGGLGIAAQWAFGKPAPTLTLEDTRVDANMVTGVYAGGTTLKITGSFIGNTKPRADGQYGDGVVLEAAGGLDAPVISTVELSSSVLLGNARAAIVASGADVTFEKLGLRCNAFDIEFDPLIRFDIGEVERAPTFADNGGSTCGCGNKLASCRAQPTSLAPSPRL